jgi:hypothetical protein
MIRVIDVGCAPAGTDPEPYAPLVKAGLAEVIGFEATAGHAIGDGSTQTLHVTSNPLQVSLFEPNFAVLDRFVGLSPMFEVVKTQAVKTERLDDFPECRGADYLKLDVQGAEALVLAGAGETLKSVLVVHTEVSFVPFYKGQAMLGDVDGLLRAAGFHFHLSPGFAQRQMTGMPDVGGSRQFLYGDFVYVRDFTKWDGLTCEQADKMNTILQTCYDSRDMARYAYELWAAKGGAN